MSRLSCLPVFMYHSVAPPGALAPHGWLERLSTSVEMFEETLSDWKRRGIRTVGGDEIRDFLDGRGELPSGSVALTFDDGYLDNWVAVTPLLQRYGMKAIIFVSTDFVDPGGKKRPTLEDTASPELWQGYLSVPEMQAMVASGAVEIQSHAASHTWKFISPRIVDFYGPHWNIEHPKCRYRFLWMNRNRSLKPFALKHLRRDAVAWGTPVYEFAPALVARQYRPDPDLEEALVSHVAGHEGGGFFRRPDWKADLERVAEDHRSRFGERGTHETGDERRRRLMEELSGSRQFLEEVTGRPVRFLSPPQGGANEETFRLARECGYDLVTAPSAGRLRLNRAGAGLGWVHRCGTGYDLFGRNRGRKASLRSQRLVQARCSGRKSAALLTKTVGLARRLVG